MTLKHIKNRHMCVNGKKHTYSIIHNIEVNNAPHKLIFIGHFLNSQNILMEYENVSNLNLKVKK